MVPRSRLFLSALLLLAFASSAAAADLSGLPSRFAVDKGKLRAGQYLWLADVQPSEPLVMVVSLSQQLVYVYRYGTLVALSTISSGRKGYETPAGTFSILERKRIHHSNLYDNAPMPFMLRLTWDGVALHGGELPGRRASHGCIRLPMAFARELFAVSEAIGLVIVTHDAVAEGFFDGYPILTTGSAE